MSKQPIDMSIEELVEHRRLVESYLLRSIQLARQDGLTWREIGAQLGVTGSEAARKYNWIEKTNRLAPPANTGL